MNELTTLGKVWVEHLTQYSGTDLDDLCEATESAIVEGGGFGWLKPPPSTIALSVASHKSSRSVPEYCVNRSTDNRGCGEEPSLMAATAKNWQSVAGLPPGSFPDGIACRRGYRARSSP